MPGSNSSFSDDEDQIVDVFPSTPCLFCLEEFNNPLKIYEHCIQEHNFNVYEIIKEFKLDTFDYIKLINYIRSTLQENPKCDIKSKIRSYDWRDEKYLKPLLSVDGLLMIDLEELDELANVAIHNSKKDILNLTNGELSTENSSSSKRIKINHNNENQFKKTISLLKSKVDYLEDTLGSMKENMKALSEKLLEFSSNTNENASPSQNNISSNENDNQYFNSYAYISIHEDMLKDTTRTGSYRDAIMAKNADNSNVFKNHIVLDVGCGTGILSMFSARAGAKMVFAVDQSDIIYEAMDIAKENGLDEKITFIKGKIEDITLPVEKVDIIVSEWMGYFLLSESMMSSVIRARDKYLAPDGLMLPSRLCLYLQPALDKSSHADKLAYWDDVYGFKMSCLKKIKKREIDLDDLNVRMAKDPTIKLVSDPVVIKEFDMMRVREDEIEVKKFSFEFQVITENPTQEITSFLCYFDVYFYPETSPNQVYFSTGPKSPSTHWKQTVLHLPDPVIINKGESLKGTISLTQLPHDVRTWCIELDLGSPGKQYIFDLS